MTKIIARNHYRSRYKKRSSKRSSSSSSTIIERNDDLLTEILVLLPAESLTRFRVVSKRWRLLISAYWFWFRHHRRETQRPSFILSGNATKFLICKPGVRTPLPRQFSSGISSVFGRRVQSVQVVQSCNGLVLLRCQVESGFRYYVFNPTTLQRRSLAPLPDHCGSSDISFDRVFLMFDPSASPHYRVVCFLTVDNKYNDAWYNIYMYSSETHRWKLSNDDIRISMGFFSWKGGVYFNGGICFLGECALSPSPRIIRNGVVINIPDPPLYHYPECWKRHYAKESNGVLFWLTLYWGNDSNILHACEMKEIENGWSDSDKYKVDMKPILDTCGASSCRDIKVVGMFGGGKEQDNNPLLMLLLFEKKVVSYRFCDGVCEVVVDYSTTTAHKESFKGKQDNWYVHHFIQSIAPV